MMVYQVLLLTEPTPLLFVSYFLCVMFHCIDKPQFIQSFTGSYIIEVILTFMKYILSHHRLIEHQRSRSTTLCEL